ncbi:predicted protein [Nematostella vectensis]|uniref:Ribitol-5-phosphate transferase n=1 Tax=Nematostella vectensis TaxID=45351 RepID=A7RY81_NEMVE|nr:ribitol 5-phosphate transferase FKRP [Nematostella vectensis]EDO43590.1 predicted protein [Nematostella vectensis]|eukprot:XP_001635653.1 predicted protein [Nematostella vectensis]
MAITNCQLLLICLILGNCAILFYISHIQQSAERETLREQIIRPDERQEDVIRASGRVNSVKAFETQVTVLILEFEDFENDVVRTIQSILHVFPKIRVIVLAQHRPYPPLDFPDDNVKLVIQETSPEQRQSVGRPESYISTPYVIFVPDGSRLKSPNIFLFMLSSLKESEKTNSKIIAVPVENRFYVECHTLKVDLKKWTLQYEMCKNKSGNFMLCDSVSQSVAVILKTAFLHSLSTPYMRPFPQSLFIQASIHHVHTKLLFKSSIPRRIELFTNPHNDWKHKHNMKERHIQMYKRFGIKKVDLPDGTVQWYGCGKNTKRCFGTIVDDMPAYLYNNQWTPPCCLEHLRESARHVFEVLDNSGVSYWLEGGSLLGAVRHSDIIPWDYDVDIGIYQSQIRKCKPLFYALEQSRSGSKFIDEKGFVWEKSREGEFFRVQFSQINHLHVDIFPFYEKNGKMTKDTWFKTHRQDMEFPVHFLKPLTKIKFVGVLASAPNHIKDFLELKFGKGVIENPQYPNPLKLGKTSKSEKRQSL